jgi:outer membrane protein TolC
MILACVLGGLSLESSLASATPLDLRTAVETGLRSNPALHSAREKLEEGGHLKSLAASSLFPSLTASSSATYKKDSIANKSVSSVAFSGEPYNSYAASLGLTQTLFQWGALAAVRAADYDRLKLETDLEIAERSLARDIIKAFYRLSLERNTIDILLDEQKVVDANLKTAQSRLRIGGKRVDYLQVKVQAALLKPQIETAKINLASSAAELAKLMGATEGTKLELRGRIPYLSSKDVEKKINFKEFSLPELERLRLSREQLGEQRSVSLGKHLPNLSLEGDYNFTNYSKSDLFDSASNAWSVQLLLKVPLFSGFASIYERKASYSREAQLELDERDLRNNLSLTQIKAKKTLEAAELSLASAAEAASLAKESLGEARRDYNYGVIDFLQYLQVQRSNFDASTSLNQLKYDNIVALTDYFVASGQPLGILIELLGAEEQKP